jgi:hypothetical protein
VFSSSLAITGYFVVLALISLGSIVALPETRKGIAA